MSGCIATLRGNHAVREAYQMAGLGLRAKALRLVAAGGIAAAVMLPTAAFAQETAGCPYGSGICGGTHSGGSGNGSQQTGSAGTGSTGGSLPFTGGDAVGLGLIGLGAVAGGVALTRS